MRTENLKKWRKELINCTQCGFCKEVCPVFEEIEWDSSAARGRMSLCYGLYCGDIEPDGSVMERLYQCTTCTDCTRRCPSSTAVVDVVEAARKDIVAAGLANEGQKRIAGSIKRFGNPFEETQSREEMLGEAPRQAEIAYYTGCTAAYRNIETAKAGISILKKLNADYTLLDEVCCGSVLSRLGFPDEDIETQVDTNLKAIEATGAKTVLFSCAGCLRMFKKEYPKFRKLPFRVLHFTEWLNEQDITLQPYEKTVTYHDPCHIGRHLGIYEPPRTMIQKIPKVNFVEMKDNREMARCCGGGGGVRSGFPEVAGKIAARRMEQAMIADILVTTCPFCVNNLKMGRDIAQSKVEVRDLLEVIDELLDL
ncbi:MAG: (Fe-S)-binding protein [Methanosarcinaceae archaeon]|nr:(Fe-S)-binding protein [Methanosarcinaceae archaeon]